jgi:hypothetical protein
MIASSCRLVDFRDGLRFPPRFFAIPLRRTNISKIN